MARTTINFQQIVRTGLNPALAAPDGVDGLAVGNLVVAVPNAESREIGPFPPGIYNQSNGMVNVDWSGVTIVTAGVFRL